MTAASSLVGPLRLNKGEKMLTTEYISWARRMNNQVPFFMNIYFEDFLDTDINEVRKEFNFIEPPKPNQWTKKLD